MYCLYMTDRPDAQGNNIKHFSNVSPTTNLSFLPRLVNKNEMHIKYLFLVVEVMEKMFLNSFR